MPWTAIVNPVAGRGRTQKLLPELERAASAAGIALHVSPEPGAPTKLARAAADDGHDLVACGGDGLVTEVAGVAADTGRRLAIVPTGAGNDFARVLGYDPKHPLRAFDAIAHGRDRVVDLGRVNGRWYTCVTASGFDAEANRWANTVRKLSGTTLYVAAVLRTLAVYKPHQFRVTVDGDVARDDGLARRGRQRPRVRGRHARHARPRASTTACSTSRSSARCRGPSSSGTSPRCSRATTSATRRSRRCGARSVHLESLDASIPMEVYADGERVGPLPGTMEAVRDALNVRVP